MNEIMERVAKAIFSKMEFPDVTEAEAYARAAIEAMRKPTEDMLDATGGECRKWAPGAWQAMIDECLK